MATNSVVENLVNCMGEKILSRPQQEAGFSTIEIIHTKPLDLKKHHKKKSWGQIICKKRRDELKITILST